MRAATRSNTVPCRTWHGFEVVRISRHERVARTLYIAGRWKQDQDSSLSLPRVVPTPKWILRHDGFAKPSELRPVPDDRKSHGGIVLGHIGGGTRRPATGPDKWKGHLVTLVEDIFLVDSTFDQVNLGRPDLRAQPLVLDLRQTKWFDQDPPYNCPWTVVYQCSMECSLHPLPPPGRLQKCRRFPARKTTSDCPSPDCLGKTNLVTRPGSLSLSRC